MLAGPVVGRTVVGVLVIGVLVVGVPVVMAVVMASGMTGRVVAIVVSNQQPERRARRASACGAHISSHLN